MLKLTLQIDDYIPLVETMKFITGDKSYDFWYYVIENGEPKYSSGKEFNIVRDLDKTIIKTTDSKVVIWNKDGEKFATIECDSHRKFTKALMVFVAYARLDTTCYPEVNRNSPRSLFYVVKSYVDEM